MPFDPSTAKLFDPTSAQLVEVEEEASTLDKLKGAGEAALSLATGAIGGGLGTLSGTIAGIRQHGVGTEAQRRAVEAEASRQAEALTYVPRTAKGQEYMEPVGEFIGRYVLPISPLMAELEGASMARKFQKNVKKAQKPSPAAEPVRTPNLSDILMEADQAPENQRVGPPTRATFDPTSAKLVEEAPIRQQKNLRQGQFDFTPEQQPMPVTPEGTVLTTPEQIAGYVQFGRQMETPEAPPQAPLRGQGDLFLTDEVTGPIASPINAAERGALGEPVANPALARRQMELQLVDEGVLNVSPEGEITRGLPEQTRTITESPEQIAFAQAEAERSMREQQAKAAVETGQTGELFGDYVNKHRDYELFRDEDGRPLSRTDFNTTVDNLAKDKQTGYIRPENMDEAYAKYLDNFGGVQAGLFDQPTTAKAMTETLKADAAERMANSHPLIRAAEKFVAQEQQFLDQLKQQGASLEAIKQAADDVAAATARMEDTRTNILKSIRTSGTAKGVRPLRKGGYRAKQGGGATTDFLGGLLSLGLDKKIGNLAKKVVDVSPNEKKTQHIPKVVKGLEDYTKERRPAEDIIREIKEKRIPDMKATPVSDKFQAGGLYKQLETNNPIVRKTFAAVSDAYNRAHTNIRDAIQDPKKGLPALFRGLTKQEAADWWSARQIAEGDVNLTVQQMREMGMNEKQIRMNERFNEITDYVFTKVNEARALAGKTPIDKRIGYLAGQASGDFRRLIYKRGAEGEKQVVGILGADTRVQLDRRVGKLKEAHPEWEIGNETMANRGRRDNRQKAFEDAVEMLAENNPDTKALLDAYDNILRDDAYKYMNAKKHTMQKKGVFGTEGFKRDVDAWTNAKEGMASQIRYIEKMFNWAEMSKAVNEVKPLLADDSINMPNAKRWSSDYIDRALGIQNSEVGAALDGIIGAVGKQMGVGPSAIERGVGATKNAVSKYLLGFGNPLFLAINLVQPAVATPAIRSLLKGRGLDVSSGTVTRGAMDFAMMQAHERFPNRFKLDAVQREIYNEGKKRNIFGSEIFEHSPHLTKGRYRFNQLAELGISNVEGATRGSVFTSMSKLLHENGYRGTKLFDIAENLTNQIMTDYRNFEAPAIYKEMGAVGEMAVTLQRYKHNSLSNLAMLTREAKRNKNYRPLVTALTTGIAVSGLTGMLGFNEADFLYQQATKAMGKPDTLSRLLLDSGTPDALTYGGVSALTGLDMSKRFGMTLFPDSPSGAIFPGISRIGEIASSGAEALKSPSETNLQRFARDVVPNTLRGAMERQFFETDEGLSINPRTLEGQVQRTETDKFAKSIGGTGLHESKQKARLYQESLVDKAYTDKRNSTTKKIFDDLFQLPKEEGAIAEYFESERGQELRDKFLENEGNIDNLINAVVKFQTGKQTTALQRKMLQAAAAQKEGDLKKAKRYKQLKESLDD